jgi:hypothetical protein
LHTRWQSEDDPVPLELCDTYSSDDSPSALDFIGRTFLECFNLTSTVEIVSSVFAHGVEAGSSPAPYLMGPNGIHKSCNLVLS